MLDQAHTLRKLVESAAPAAPAAFPAPPMIVVTGGRAKVGSTTVAVNLAAVLADQGERVVLVDAAPHDAGVEQIAGGLAIERSISEVVAGGCRAAEALAPGPAGTLVLAHRRSEAAHLDCSRRGQQRLLAGLQSLQEEASLLVIDTGSGLTPWTRRFWLRARLVLAVTTTDDLALMDCYALVKRSMADGIAADLRVLANQCDSDAIASDVYGRLSNACQRFLSQRIRTLPPLPTYRPDDSPGGRAVARVWEAPNTAFGHAALWLGQAVSAAMENGEATAVNATCGARVPREFSRNTARC